MSALKKILVGFHALVCVGIGGVLFLLLFSLPGSQSGDLVPLVVLSFLLVLHLGVAVVLWRGPNWSLWLSGALDGLVAIGLALVLQSARRDIAVVGSEDSALGYTMTFALLCYVVMGLLAGAAWMRSPDKR